MATERMKKASGLIAAGRSVEEAMEEAGYGMGCIPGLAPEFPAILAAAGLPSGPVKSAKGKAQPAPEGEPAATETAQKPTKTEN